MDTCDVFSCQTESMSEISQMYTRLKIGIFGDAKSFFNTTEVVWENSKNSTAMEFIMIYFLCTFLVFSFVGSSITAFECLFKNKFKNYALHENDMFKKNMFIGWLVKCKTFFNCFCLITNARKLLNTEPANGEIPCLHGIRLFSQVCIINCHIAGQLVFTAIRNLKDHVHVLDTWTSHIGTLAVFHSVDTFFLLSGMLNAYSFFQNETNKKVKSWFHFYAHRFMRLTPTYMIIVGFYALIFPHVGSGPLWSVFPEEQICKKYWWRNLLYINNMWPVSEMCMTWSWFLSNDMQFFVISPLFLITLKRWPKVGKFILAVFLCGTVLANFIITCYSKLPNFLLHVYSHLGQRTTLNIYIKKLLEYHDQIYIMPYMRIAPYIIGVGLAHYLNIWNQQKKMKPSTASLYCGWTISAISILYLTFGVSHPQPSIWEACFYNALNQICFASVIAWIIFVCITGQGGIINKILSLKRWIPLSRLSYCAYLIHPIFALGYFASLQDPIDFSDITLALTILTTGSIAVALFVHLFFEYPIFRLEKLIVNT